MSQKARNQGGKVWPDLSAPEGFMQGPYPSGRSYANPPEPGKVRSALGPAAPGATLHALREGSTRITRINEGTRQGIRKRIQEAIEQGMSPAEAGAYVREWTGFDEYRAERIARTEMMFSYNAAATSTYAELGVTQVVADDGDEDEECAERHGQVFSVEEAASIIDHPNGTLDWLPVEPTTGTTSLMRGQLQGQRPIRGFAENPGTFPGAEPPPPPPPVEPPAPPPVAPVAGQVSPRSAAAEATIEDFQQSVLSDVYRKQDILGWDRARWGEEQATSVLNGTGEATPLPGAPHLSGRVEQARWIWKDNTVVVYSPGEYAPGIGRPAVEAALERGGDIRIFNSKGQWVELRPYGPQPELTSADWEAFMQRLQAGAAQGEDEERVWVQAFREMMKGRAEVNSGQLELRALAERQARQLAKEAEERAKLLAEEARQARIAQSPLRKMPRHEMEQAIRDGKVKLEDVAEQRWGWTGGKPGTPDAGKFVVRPGPRTKAAKEWSRDHDAMFFRAFEDVADRVGGYDRMRIDVVRFGSAESKRAAADYGMAGYHVAADRAEGIVQNNRIHFYLNTSKELGTTSREYGNAADGFYNVAIHELGHSFDYGSATMEQRNAFTKLMEAARARGKAPVAKYEEELGNVQRSLDYSRKAAADITRDLERGWQEGMYPRDPVEWRTYYQGRLDDYVQRADAYEKQAQQLRDQVEMANQLLAAAQQRGEVDYLMTNYSGYGGIIGGQPHTRGTEAWAEAVVYYVSQPEVLRQRAPAMYRFIEGVINYGEHYVR